MVKLCWPNGGMGNSIYTLLCLCTTEINQSFKEAEFPTSGTDWHFISDRIKTKKIVKVHPAVLDDAIKVGSTNFYFVKLLSWAKWEGFPDVKTPEELELLHLMLNDWKPTILVPDFEITRLFDKDAVNYIDNFIRQIGFTPNKNIETVAKYLVKNNEIYYNKIKYLEQLAKDAIEKKFRLINVIKPYEQALLMTMIYHYTNIPFKLVYGSFNNTNDIWDSMENTNGKAF